MIDRSWFIMHPHIDLTLKLILGFFLLFLVTKLMGRKQIKSYTPFDFIFVMFLGGILEETAFAEDEPFLSLILAVVIWAGINLILQKSTIKSEFLQTYVKGKPIMIIEDGTLNIEVLKQQNMELEQLRQALREKNIFSLEEVQYAILEIDGSINVKKYTRYEYIKHKDVVPRMYSDEPLPVMVVEEGKIVPEEISGVSKKWVDEKLNELSLENRNDIIYAEKKGNKLYYKLRYAKSENNQEADIN